MEDIDNSVEHLEIDFYCQKCGYNLRGQAVTGHSIRQTECPECGTVHEVDLISQFFDNVEGITETQNVEKKKNVSRIFIWIFVLVTIVSYLIMNLQWLVF